MHWWQSAFSSTPSSSSSSSSPSATNRRSADDNFINNRSTPRVSDVFSLISRGRGFSFGSHQRRRLTRARKLRHLTDDDVGRSSASSTGTPQPLPLPELAVLLRRDARRDAANQVAKYVLPSPKDGQKKAVEKQRICDAEDGDSKGIQTRANTDHVKDMEQAESQLVQKSPKGQNGTGIRSRDKGSDTISAPSSPTSAPAVSPVKSTADIFASYYISPTGLQVWSAPEMHPPDMNLGVANPFQAFPERSTYSVDGSPLPSPRQITGVKSPIISNSPLPKTLAVGVEYSLARRDSNAQATVATVHPLPLPPGASAPRSSSPPPQINSKPESIPRTPKQSQWQKGKLIGRGTFGSVYVGSNRETGALCAMKEVELLPDDPKAAECIKQLEQEINVLSQLKHPNIVQYYGSEIVNDRFYIYLEYVHPGSINKYVRDHCGGMTESIVRNFTRHIVSGLAYLHSTKTIHRDIKGANLLVDANGVVKLADFGMAKHLNEQASHLSLKGSPYWMAPELLQCGMQKDANPDLALAVDIWSLGCTIIEMMNGRPPWSEYEGPAAMFKVMKETPPIPETMSPEGKDFLRCCFVRDPAERPTASMLLEHRFLKNSNQLDISSSTDLLNGMTLMDKGQHQTGCLGNKLDQLSVSTGAHTTKGQVLNNSDFMHSSFPPVRMANDLVLRLPT